MLLAAACLLAMILWYPRAPKYWPDEFAVSVVLVVYTRDQCSSNIPLEGASIVKLSPSVSI